MNHPVACPTLTQLQQLLLGEIALPEAERLAAHLESCPACAARAQQVQAENSFTSGLRAAAATKLPPPDSAARQLMGRLRRITDGLLQTSQGEHVMNKDLPPPEPYQSEDMSLPVDSVVGSASHALRPTAARSLAASTDTPPSAHAPMRQTSAGAGMHGPPSLQPGYQLDRFKIEALLGRGGMGEVWKAFDPTRRGHVVIKVLPSELRGNAFELDRIKESFQKISHLHHQHICPVHELKENDPQVGNFLVMHFVDGVHLAQYRRDYAKKHGAFPVSELLRVLRPIAEAMDYAHKHGIIHRDLKPANIMVAADGSNPQLVDFGLVEEVRRTVSRVSLKAPDLCGTFPYMAPELLRYGHPDAGSDQYALAVVAFELLAGRLPFDILDPEAMRDAIKKEPPPPLPGQPNHIQWALEKGLAKKPEDRFTNCAGLLDALEKPVLLARPTILAPAASVALAADVRGSSSLFDFKSVVLAVLAVALLVSVLWPRTPAQQPQQDKQDGQIAQITPKTPPGDANNPTDGKKQATGSGQKLPDNKPNELNPGGKLTDNMNKAVPPQQPPEIKKKAEEPQKPKVVLPPELPVVQIKPVFTAEQKVQVAQELDHLLLKERGELDFLREALAAPAVDTRSPEVLKLKEDIALCKEDMEKFAVHFTTWSKKVKAAPLAYEDDRSKWKSDIAAIAQEKFSDRDLPTLLAHGKDLLKQAQALETKSVLERKTRQQALLSQVIKAGLSAVDLMDAAYAKGYELPPGAGAEAGVKLKETRKSIQAYVDELITLRSELGGKASLSASRLEELEKRLADATGKLGKPLDDIRAEAAKVVFELEAAAKAEKKGFDKRKELLIKAHHEAQWFICTDKTGKAIYVDDYTERSTLTADGTAPWISLENKAWYFGSWGYKDNLPNYFAPFKMKYVDGGGNVQDLLIDDSNRDAVFRQYIAKVTGHNYRFARRAGPIRQYFVSYSDTDPDLLKAKRAEMCKALAATLNNMKVLAGLELREDEVNITWRTTNGDQKEVTLANTFGEFRVSIVRPLNLPLGLLGQADLAYAAAIEQARLVFDKVRQGS